MRKLKRPIVLTVKHKLVLYALSMLIPVVIFTGIYLLQSQRTLEEKAGHLISESLALSMSWMDEVLGGAVRISAAVESDNSVREFILQHQTAPIGTENVITLRAIEDRFAEILKTENRATSVWIYFPFTNEVISSQYGVYQVSDNKALEWLKDQRVQGKLRTWVYPDDRTPQYGGSHLDLTGLKGSAYVSFIREIDAMGTNEYPIIIGVGYLEFMLHDLLGEVAKKTKTSLLLLDRTGQIVNRTNLHVPDTFPMQTVIDRFASASADPLPSFILDDWLLAASRSKLTGWEVVAIAPLNPYMSGLQKLNLIAVCFTLSALLFAVFTARSLTRGVHEPLKKLLVGMKRMEGGDLTTRVDYEREDEFKQVAAGFNRMAETQDWLIRTVYEERIAKQQAEMHALTAQMNPHFLYNTLGALYTMAKRVDDGLANSLLAMARFFRLSLNQGKEMVTVRQSIDHIADYMHLMQIRNPLKYKLETYVEPNAEPCTLPHLILQPIVENAIKHGLEMTSGQGVIRISVTLLSEHLLLMVSDNGAGMDAQTLDRLRQSIAAGGWQGKGAAAAAQEAAAAWGDVSGSGYALGNIYRRLQLKYGDRFAFQIDSEPGKGTNVMIRLPREEVREDEAFDRG